MPEGEFIRLEVFLSSFNSIGAVIEISLFPYMDKMSYLVLWNTIFLFKDVVSLLFHYIIYNKL